MNCRTWSHITAPIHRLIEQIKRKIWLSQMKNKQRKSGRKPRGCWNLKSGRNLFRWLWEGSSRSNFASDCRWIFGQELSLFAWVAYIIRTASYCRKSLSCTFVLELRKQLPWYHHLFCYPWRNELFASTIIRLLSTKRRTHSIGHRQWKF